ncbi:hypothetical protein CF386_10050 [Paraphotobacterium marinum]|uniref:Uncharacterized protein n=1 Tax=Paraphotobacterium marinum TaxID=1755811 RepID=A0A220VHH1_9GAMM|nr:hypothetical protein [Paraphotobacterium marinum]ASK79393.1 hypothetical protein CF386_10050 [Paraphotobacterium marinum]
MTKKNRSYNNVFKSYTEVLNSQLQPGETLFYVRDNLLPTLNIKVMIKERSKEAFSHIDLMILRLIEQGISSIKSIVVLTALAEKLVIRHVSDMVAKSFVEIIDSKHFLTELGEETLRYGIPIKIVQRAFLYCAVSERLLPRDAYNLSFTPIENIREDEFKRKIRENHILEESNIVNLKGLDLSLIKCKYDFNLTDETMEFGNILEYSSGYLQTRIFLAGISHPERAIIAFGKNCVEYELHKALPTIDSFKDSDIVKKLEEFNLDQEKKSKLTFGKGNIVLDEFGLPIIKIIRANKDWLSKGIESGHKGILMCGTDEIPAKPIGLRAWGKFSSLSGLTVRYFLTEKSLKDDAFKLRQYIEKRESLSKKEIEQLIKVAEKYSLSKIIKDLSQMELKEN